MIIINNKFEMHFQQMHIIGVSHNYRQLGAPHIEVIGDRTQAQPDNVANEDSHLGIANNDCMIFLMEHCRLHRHCKELAKEKRENLPNNSFRFIRSFTHDAFDTHPHFRANHMNEHVHCTKVHQCTVAPQQFHSSRSNNAYMMFHARICRIANRNDLFAPVHLKF